MTGEKIFREKGNKAETREGRYIIVVLAVIENLEGNYLFQKTSLRKKGVWALPGGHLKSGQTSEEAICEEILEEMGINIDKKEVEMFKFYKYENAFKDVYIIHKDIDLNELKLKKDKVEKVAYLSKREIFDLIAKKEIRITNLDVLQDIFQVNL